MICAKAAPTLWLIAGPDGAGKTTYAFGHIRAVSGSADFVNIDEIARGILPLAPDAAPRTAARVALGRIDELIASGRSFSLETTLAGLTHLRTIERAHDAGFSVTLLYFAVRDVNTCLTRIARRVSEGGHTVPPANVRRRFVRSITNFPRYVAQVDLWRVFDSDQAKLSVVAEGRRNCCSINVDVGLNLDLARLITGLAPLSRGGLILGCRVWLLVLTKTCIGSSGRCYEVGGGTGHSARVGGLG